MTSFDSGYTIPAHINKPNNTSVEANVLREFVPFSKSLTRNFIVIGPFDQYSLVHEELKPQNVGLLTTQAVIDYPRDIRVKQKIKQDHRDLRYKIVQARHLPKGLV